MLGVVIAAPLWRKQYTTFGDLFRERYSPGVERLAVLLMVPTSVLWAAAQIRAFGQVVSACVGSRGVGRDHGRGRLRRRLHGRGRLARRRRTRTSCRASRVVVGLVVLLVAVGNAHGGVGELVASIDPARLALFSTADATPLEIVEAWAVPVCGSLLAVEMLSRILGCKTAATARNATLVGAAIYLVVGLDPRADRARGARTSCRDSKSPSNSSRCSREQHLSTFLYVLFAGALISAILSTVDSCLLAAGSLGIAQPRRAAEADAHRRGRRS